MRGERPQWKGLHCGDQGRMSYGVICRWEEEDMEVLDQFYEQKAIRVAMVNALAPSSYKNSGILPIDRKPSPSRA